MMRKGFLAILCATLIGLFGCGGGEKLTPTSGTVTLDGKPVEGASVTFVTDDGNSSFSGTTDASGNFSLQVGDKIGAAPGSYKVLVAKSPYKTTGEPMDPSAMQKMEEKQKMPSPGKQTPGMPMPGKSGSTTPGVKSDLPEIYASVQTTPLNAKVPSDGPVKLELKSKR